MNIITLPQVNSTNTHIKQLITQNTNYLDNGLTLIANTQSEGKGTHGRVWASSDPGGIYMSMALKPANFDFSLVEKMQLDVAAIICDCIHEMTGLEVRVKAPNDVYIKHKKLGGILMEASSESGLDGRLNYLIVGVGLNVNQEGFPTDIEKIATSLFLEMGRAWHKKALCFSLMTRIESYFLRCILNDSK